MTAKRFTVDDGLENVLCWEINDKENENMTCGECAKLLNELHEENQRLQLELDKDILFTPSRHSKTVRMDFLERYTELVNYETKVKETLQDYKGRYSEMEYCYGLIGQIAKRLGVDLE